MMKQVGVGGGGTIAHRQPHQQTTFQESGRHNKAKKNKKKGKE